MTRPDSTSTTAPDTPAPQWDDAETERRALAHHDALMLMLDAREATRDARRFPNSAPDLHRYAEYCRDMARQIMNGAPYHVDAYGWPHLDTPSA